MNAVKEAALATARVTAEYVPVVARQAKETTVQASKWAAENPGRVASGVVGTVGIAIIAAPVVVTLPLLGAAGFTAGGVQAGTIAAGVQAGIGSVAGGSLFALFQSAGALGAGAAVVNGAAQVVGGVIAAGAAVAAVVTKH